jgi:translation initiation factor 1 (eIF-1/SUI1)
LLKNLKQTLGAGGTYFMDRKEGALEIQGDHQVRIRAFLQKLEIKTN